MGRYRAVEISSGFIAPGAIRKWGVEDELSNDANQLVKDPRKRYKTFWKGTEQEATDFARLLNKDRDETRNGQIVEKAREGIKARREKIQATPVVIPVFNKCEACGSRYKGEHHCDGP